MWMSEYRFGISQTNGTTLRARGTQKRTLDQ